METNLHNYLQGIADAIKEKTGDTTINAQDFASKIESIEVGGGGDNELAMGLLQRSITEYSNETITTIGSYAFAGCSKLTRLHLPALQYTSNLFVQGTGLTNLDMPSLKEVGNQGFQAAASLGKITLGESFAKVGNMAFYGCTSLHTIIIKSKSLTSLGSSALYNTKIDKKEGYVYVPDDLVDAYKGATNWSNFAGQIKPMSELPNE